MAHFGVYIPLPLNNNGQQEPRIFTDRVQAFKILKTHKDARLKIFYSCDEATFFSKNGFEKPSPTSSTSSNNKNNSITNETGDGGVTINGGSNDSQTNSNSTSSSSTAAMMEKSSYRCPKSQELVQFRKLIEGNKIDEVKDLLWKNPRYLVGSGDTPTILKESFRYNALHVTALAKLGKMCEALLEIIGDPNFIQLLYGKNNAHNCQEASSMLLDLYLNMPEKGRNDTPLHLAVKFGAYEVVEVLTSYPQCCASRNSEGLYPKDTICSRLSPDLPRTQELIEIISELLSERFYVPVIRSVDNSIPPIIGEPFSPSNPPNLVFDPLSPLMKIEACAGPMSKEQAQIFRKRWKTPPRITSPSPNRQHVVDRKTNDDEDDGYCGGGGGGGGSSGSRTPTFSLSPYIISPLQIRRFTPNKQQQLSSTPNQIDTKSVRRLFPIKATELINQQQNEINKTSPPTVADDDVDNKNVLNESIKKDLEPLNESIENDKDELISMMKPPKSLPIIPVIKSSSLNNEFNSNLFKSYRDNRFNNIDDSFQLNSSTESNPFDSPMHKERHVKLVDAEKGWEVIGRELAKDQNVRWREYWSFLEEFADFNTIEGIAKLNQFLKQKYEKMELVKKCSNLIIDKKNIKTTTTTTTSPPTPSPKTPLSTVDTLCSALSQFVMYSPQFVFPPVLSSILQQKPSIQSKQQLQQNKQLSPPQQQQLSTNQITNNDLNIKNRRNVRRRLNNHRNNEQENTITQNLQQTNSNNNNTNNNHKQISGTNEINLYLCVEKSVQVYAKRMANKICQYLSNVVVATINEFDQQIENEFDRFKEINQSYVTDKRFKKINFNYSHSRYAHLVFYYLTQMENCDFEKVSEQVRQHFSDNINEDKWCFPGILLKYLNDSDSHGAVISPEVITTEKDAMDIWTNEKLCECYLLSRSRNTQRSKKYQNNRSDWCSSSNSIAPVTTTTTELSEQEKNKNDYDSYRSVVLISSEDEDDYDSDALSFNSLSDSEDDIFYTPPQSPIPCDEDLLSLSITTPIKEVYKIYLQGEYPTKTDIDVLNAMISTVYDKEKFTYVNQWQEAIMQFSDEERITFSTQQPVKQNNLHNQTNGTNGTNNIPPKKSNFESSPPKELKVLTTATKTTTTTTTETSDEENDKKESDVTELDENDDEEEEEEEEQTGGIDQTISKTSIISKWSTKWLYDDVVVLNSLKNKTWWPFRSK